MPISTLFDDYLARLERGEVTDFESLCDENPEQADELRRLEELRTSVALAEKPTPVSLFRVRGGHETALHGAWNLAAGRILGDFRLVKCIGRGGMGEVWEAEQLSLSRRVALKVLLPERVDTRNLDYFAREARAGGKLAHPGIVAVYGTGETEGVHWIAMELVQENCDLGHALDGWREAEEVGAEYYAHVAGFVAELADAIEAAHAAGVIHRDLKPSNVLVTSDDRPKLTDFGLAKLVHEQSLSVVGEVAGTYYYMSPEQVALKHAGIDHRTDIFSLGVVLYEMLTLVRPFSGDTSEQVARKILWEEAPDPRNIRSRTPQDLAVICAKAMEKEPARRYQTMEELAADLRRHLAHEPILATPSGALVRLQKWSRRNPTKSVAGAVGVVALVAISVLAWKLNLKRTALAETNEQLQTKTTEAEGSASLATQRADELAQANEQLEAKTAEAEASASLAIRRADELVQANEALSAERSAAEAARAEAAAQRDQAEKRAEELQQVSDFQAGQLAGVDAEAMGQTIRTMVLERARAAGERAGRDQQVLAEEQETLEGLLGGADFTGLALEVLDKEIFVRALAELEKLENQPLVQAPLLETVAAALFRLGLWDRGLGPQEKAVALNRRELGDEHPNTLMSIGNLATMRYSMGEFKEAEQLFRERLEISQRTLGGSHESTLATCQKLSALLNRVGREDEAESLIRETIAKRQKTLGADHPDTLRSQYFLAGILINRDPAEAESIMRVVLDGQRRSLEDNDPQIHHSLTRLGDASYRQGRLVEAERVWREVLDLYRQTLGSKHPTTLDIVSRISQSLTTQGNLQDAEAFAREAYDGFISMHGADHHSTTSAQGTLGRILLLQRRPAEAETLLRDYLEGKRRVVGPDHVTTLAALDDLSSALYLNGHLEEAESMLRESLERRIRVFGAEHQTDLLTLRNMGLVLLGQGKLDEAELFLNRALERCVLKFGADHTRTVGIRRALNDLRAARKADADNEGGGR
jgi:serine/threonine protein kinase